MLLTDEERRRFAEYLRVSIQSDESLLVQLRKIGGVPPMIVKMEDDIAAQKIVLMKLESTERQTL